MLGITGNNGKVREGKGMYGKGIFKAIEPPKKVSTFASTNKKILLNLTYFFRKLKKQQLPLIIQKKTMEMKMKKKMKVNMTIWQT